MAINEEAAIRAILKANGITGPLVPLAIKVLREQFDTGEAFGSDVLGPFTAAFNPAGVAAAEAGKISRKRSKKEKANDKKKSMAWTQANSELRNNNGQLKKGRTQKDVATRANKILKKNGTKKGQVRKTARRAFKR
ncbi:unnamed protein product [marine sediment metagenome]|uniref:Uncharacterized protein n=1 Tax=marine sediment metagenome TaxID=412755 RepID=X1CHU2_9ZZZZ